eukprot:353184-Chlamydomonas_euryale.AAC.2
MRSISGFDADASAAAPPASAPAPSPPPSARKNCWPVRRNSAAAVGTETACSSGASGPAQPMNGTCASPPVSQPRCGVARLTKCAGCRPPIVDAAGLYSSAMAYRRMRPPAGRKCGAQVWGMRPGGTAPLCTTRPLGKGGDCGRMANAWPAHPCCGR